MAEKEQVELPFPLNVANFLYLVAFGSVFVASAASRCPSAVQ